MPVVEVGADGDEGVDVASGDLSGLADGEEECGGDDEVWGDVVGC